MAQLRYSTFSPFYPKLTRFFSSNAYTSLPLITNNIFFFKFSHQPRAIPTSRVTLFTNGNHRINRFSPFEKKKKIHQVLPNRCSFVALFSKKKKNSRSTIENRNTHFYTYVYTACLACKLPNHTQSWRQPRLETQISRGRGTHLPLPPSPLKCSTMRFRVLHYN